MTASPAMPQDQAMFTPDLHAKATEDYANDALSLDGTEDPGPCSCCNKVIDEGQVILFNNKCWHPACFKCITCDSLLDTTMNGYLDGEGNPICVNCMHNCSICNQPITEFAMMYGKEMYHEECFRCQECQLPISGTVYASTSKGVYCVNCHNERMARSRKHHEERKRRAKERAEKKRAERGGTSPSPNVDRDKSLPAPPPSEPEPSPNLSSTSLSPKTPWSEAAFQSHLMAGRPNGAAEEELRAKGRNVLETEMKLNGIDPDCKGKRESSKSQRTKRQTPPQPEPSNEDAAADAFVPVVLDQSSLSNSPHPAQLDHVIGESPILGFQAQSPNPSTVPASAATPNPQIQRILTTEANRSPGRQETLPSPTQRKASLTSMAKEATEALTRKMSLRSRRKNSKAGATESEWRLEDIPRRKPSVSTDADRPSSAPRSAVPDFPIPPDTTPVPSAAADPTLKSENSSSSPVSPVQFVMRNDSVSEVSTALTPTSSTFDPKNSPPRVSATSPPVPTRYPGHSPRPSEATVEQEQSPKTGTSEPEVKNRRSIKGKSKTDKNQDSGHASNPSKASYISLGSSRPSTSGSQENPKTPQGSVAPTYESPQLPTLPSDNGLSLEDEMSQMWLQHDRQGVQSQGNTPHKPGGPVSSQSGGVFSKVASSLRREKSISSDHRGGHSRQVSKGGGPARNPSGPAAIAAAFLEEAEEEKAKLRRQLRQSVNQIVELEVKIQEEEKLMDRLEGAREALIGVETEREMALKELRVLLKHQQILENASSKKPVQATIDKILNDFEDALEKLKDHMREQIREYTAVRTNLVEETGRLRQLRDNYLQEAQHLNIKNGELSDLNNDIQRNMERGPKTDSKGFKLFKTHQRDSPAHQSVSSVQSMVFTGEASHPMYFESNKSTTDIPPADSPVSSRISDTTIIPDDSTHEVVTRAETAPVAPPKKINYWKKNTAALKKNAVKGFKSVWSGDTNVLVSSPQLISAPQLISSSSQNSGLNILLPASTGVSPSPSSTFDTFYGEVYKSHSFHPKAFKRWQKCGFCGDKLVGTELRCGDCEYQCHTKCLMSVTAPCPKPNKPKSLKDDTNSIASETSTLFGNDLTRQAEIEGRPIPYIITRCIEEVELQGMDYEGIYRKSGGASSLRAITDAFEAGGEVNFDTLAGSGDICAVTSALKQYLRTLPDPLLPYASYDRFLQASSWNDTNLRMAKFRGVLDTLPKVNYDSLSLICQHLARIVAKSDVNLMTSQNLAVVFSPTIMRDKDGSRQIVDMQSTCACTKFLIDHANTLFSTHKSSLSIDRSLEANAIPARIRDRI